MNIGEELKKAREAMGIDERFVAERTHIRREYIIALEENRFEDIELAPVYRIGFLRIYARFLKLNSDEFVAEFKSLFGAKPTKGGFRQTSSAAKIGGISTQDSLLCGETDGDAATERTHGKLNVKRLAIFGGATLIALAILVSGIVKACSSAAPDHNVPAETVPAENLPRAYKFELTSNVAQTIKIYENYKGFDRVARKPLYGACVVDQLVSANKKYTFTGRGTLYIEEEVLGGLTVTLPNQSAIDAAPAGTAPVALPKAEDQKTSPTSTKRTTWLATPKANSATSVPAQ